MQPANTPFTKPLQNPVSASFILHGLNLSLDMLIGDKHAVADCVAFLTENIPGSLSFWDREGIDSVLESTSTIVFVETELPARPGRAFIQVEDARWWFIQAISFLFPRTPPRIDPTAYISDDAVLGCGVSIGPHTVIHKNVRIDDETQIGANCTLEAGTIVGRRCEIQDNSVIGKAGMSFHRGKSGELAQFPHLAAVIIGNDVMLGAGSSIVRGMLKDTEVGDRTKIGNLVNIGHGSQIGSDCWISANTTVGGHAVLDNKVMLASSVTISNSIHIGARSRVGIGSVVTKDAPADSKLFGSPAKALRTLRPFGPTPRN